ncbi:MAG: DMT family transporter [Pseudohongiella sp.]|nr:DMT family transporter [Pseudohongiella sp.]
MTGHAGTSKHLNIAILLLVAGNFMAIIADVIVKIMGSEVPIFQYIFVRTLVIMALLSPLYRQFDWQTPLAGLRIHLLRALFNFVCMFAIVTALTLLPLATANAVFYLAPILVMLLAVVMFRERLTRWSLLAVISGFLGVIVILRPVDMGWGALAALAGAWALAFNAVLVRKLPSHQSTVHKLMMSNLLALPIITACFIWEFLSQDTGWDRRAIFAAIASSIFVMAYSISVLKAYKTVDANQVTSAEYTGLIWAALIGWIWFSEVPDLWFLLGSAMIVIPLVMLSIEQNRRLRLV